MSIKLTFELNTTSIPIRGKYGPHNLLAINFVYTNRHSLTDKEGEVGKVFSFHKYNDNFQKIPPA